MFESSIVEGRCSWLYASSISGLDTQAEEVEEQEQVKQGIGFYLHWENDLVPEHYLSHHSEHEMMRSPKLPNFDIHGR